jgi:hypothetical protein
MDAALYFPGDPEKLDTAFVHRSLLSAATQHNQPQRAERFPQTAIQ